MKREKREPLLQYKDKDNIITKLLKIRGVKDAKEFLTPTAKSLNSPYLLANIQEVADKIIEAVKGSKKITISADCDTDGLTSMAFCFRYLIQFTDNLSVVYNQRSQGHGIENQLEYIEDDTDLLIVLDSSTNSTEACKSLSDKGIDIVIIDHHEFEQDNPYATIVNPQLDDYPNKGLSGAGVLYKVLQVVDEIIGSGTVDDFIDLVAIGMQADMMNMDIIENRYLVSQGLKNITNKGLLAILKNASTDLDKINAQTISFTIAPLINGVSRMDRIELAIDLLTTDDMETCLDIATEMKEVNEKRRDIERELYAQLVTTVNPDDKVIICVHEIESKSFNGLIANKIAQEFQRPVLVMRDHLGTVAGSFRSYGDFPMKEFLKDKSVRKYINYSVGHEMAGGLGLKTENLEKFKKVVNEKLADQVFESKIVYDLELNADQVTPSLIKDIEKFNYITGNNFPVATILVKDVFVEAEPKVLGKTRETVKIKCDDIDIIKFKVDETWGSDLKPLDVIDVIGQLQLNVYTTAWNGKTTITPQIIVEDYIKKD
jgi:single-stranded-DNA-specific exonuclease